MQLRKADDEGALAEWHRLPLTVFTGPFVCLPYHYQKTEHFLLVLEIRNIVLRIHLLFFKDKYTRKTMAVVTVRFLPIE